MAGLAVHRAECERCGDITRAARLRREARTQMMVCERCYDPPHPQEFPRLVALDDPRPWLVGRLPDTSVSMSVPVVGVAATPWLGWPRPSGVATVSVSGLAAALGLGDGVAHGPGVASVPGVALATGVGAVTVLVDPLGFGSGAFGDNGWGS